MLRVSRRVVACLSILASAQAAVDVSPATAPRMEFTPLAPGTYQLQAIQSVEDATLLDERARPVRLSAFTRGKITLLTFFYTYCVDPLGCPFARQTMTLLRSEEHTSELQSQSNLVCRLLLEKKTTVNLRVSRSLAVTRNRHCESTGDSRPTFVLAPRDRLTS